MTSSVKRTLFTWGYFLILVASYPQFSTATFLAAQTNAGTNHDPRRSTPPITTTVCEVFTDSPRFDNKFVRLRAVFFAGFEAVELFDKSCATEHLWFEYGSEELNAPEGRLPVYLVRDSQWARFRELSLKEWVPASPSVLCVGCSLYRITATFVGRLDIVPLRAVQNSKGEKIAFGGGFGHLNSYQARFVMQSVSEIEPEDISAEYTHLNRPEESSAGRIDPRTLPLRTVTADKEKIVWKPITAVILRIDDRAPKLWNIYKPDKKDMLLVQLGERYLMLDVKEKQIFELDPQKLGHKGKELLWNEADKPTEPLPTEDWLIREVGPARRIRVKLSGEGRVLNIEVGLAPDERTRRY
jgi:hypothetical protein